VYLGHRPTLKIVAELGDICKYQTGGYRQRGLVVEVGETPDSATRSVVAAGGIAG
jgi:hypothetical protein